MDIEDYERDRAEKKLLMKLQEAEEAVKDGDVYNRQELHIAWRLLPAGSGSE